MDQSPVRWGILATGRISGTMAETLADVPGAKLVAVGSRSATAADEFGARFNIPHRHASYEALAADPDVDIVYVGSPHNLHRENTLLCLQSGKAVLCEKPFAVTAAEASAMTDAAGAAKRFLMEAMWTHFFPAAARIRALIAEGAIGEVRVVRAAFGFRVAWNPAHRLLNPALAGGALLDVGIYPVSFAHMVFGREPERVSASAAIGASGVDEQTGVVLTYSGGAMAILSCAVRTKMTNTAEICGTDGSILIPEPFFVPRSFLLRRGTAEETVAFDTGGTGYQYEVEEAMRCVREGALESPVMPWAKTLAIMRTLDRVRANIGLTYPFER